MLPRRALLDQRVERDGDDQDGALQEDAPERRQVEREDEIGIIRNAIAPTIELAAEPFPPKMLVPPRTTAAIELRMNWSPPLGEPDSVWAVTQMPARAASTAENA